MSFEEKLHAALQTAADHYNNGCSPDMAVCKAACSNEFNKDQTDRLVEGMNTLITLNQYKKATDKTASFPLAHKDRVAALMLDADTVLGVDQGKPVEKSASIYWEYMSPAKKCGAQDSFEKVASAHESTGKYADVSAENMAYIAVKEINMRKNASTYAHDAEMAAHGALVSALYELADDVKKKGVSKYAELKACCGHADVLEQLDKVLPRTFADVIHEKSSELLDDTEFADTLAKIASMHEVYDFMKEMHRQAALLQKQAARMQNDLAALFVEKTAAWSAEPKPLSGGDKLLAWLHPFTKAVTDEQLKLQTPVGVSDVAENTRRALLLQELLATDPILADADPDVVSSGYTTLLRTAPEVANDKELTRSILRQVAQAAAISPFDAEQWAKLNRGMKGLPYQDK